MTTVVFYPDAPDLSTEDYLVLGLATCFIKEEGEVHELQVAEPIPSAALEAIVKGIPTSYQWAIGTNLGSIFPGESSPQLPGEFPAGIHLCEEFRQRAIAAARTYKRRPSAQTLIPAGTMRQDFNHSLDRKRILNSQRIVRTEDNVKQHEYTHKVL
ncbi:hypothetical protein BST81_12310 [Leptolyngbya sp. 'hensonii']|uniref:hypothetical protein n=1 Tax=Leptolyngbya sp. 'hensonii' TaxID=1922337 RepID=UPI00094F8968|nr:hypothetical protein [Leptolyngbya sp. 'hensonii']OLP17842.1 hypothetical protein BST81_12310 [Leptolyngbya sp. 'hensonii']